MNNSDFLFFKYLSKIAILVFFTCLISVICLPTYAEKNKAKDIAKEVTEKLQDIDQKKEKEISRAITQRPTTYGEPTEIYFMGFIIDIDGIHDANQNFDANFYLGLKWKDERLADKNISRRQLPLTEVWNPGIIVINQQGRLNRALPDVVSVLSDGTVQYRQRYTGKLSQPMSLWQFPMDTHTFDIQFISPRYKEHEIQFIPDTFKDLVGGQIAKKLSLPDWQISNFRAKKMNYEPVEQISVAGFTLEFDATRLFSYYIWQIILPLSVVIVMSWAAFWLGPDQIGVRIGVATSSILTLIAHRFIIANLLPKSYMTRLDFFSVGGTLLVLLALIFVVIGANLTYKNKEHISVRIDNWSKIGFPVAYVLLLLSFLYLDT